tara:strand:- start:4680 stop:5933 length:1254 start_codon:yes stop_codon:yes gene_type:complete
MNFREAYAIWSGGDEAPEIYHQWAGLSIVSNLVSRRVWCEQGMDVVMANLFVMFVGPAGNGKSTAMKKARDIIRKHSKHCPIPPRAQTHQSLIQDLADDDSDYKKEFDWHDKKIPYSHASMFCNEFITLLGADPLGIVGFLTDIYDDDSYEYKIKNPPAGGNKLDHIQNPYITLLGCMTPEKTSGVIKEGIVSTGFSRRCIFVYATRSTKAIPRRQITTEQFEALAVIEQWSGRMIHLTGQFTWTKEAEVFFDAWYFKNKKLIMTVNDSFFASWLNSKDQIVVKVAMILTLMTEETLDMTLKPDAIKEAIKLLDQTELHFPRIFSGAGRNPIAAIAAKMHAVVAEAAEPLNLKKLRYLMRDHGKNDELDEAIENLREDGTVEIQSVVKNQTAITLVGVPGSFQSSGESALSIDLRET